MSLAKRSRQMLAGDIDVGQPLNEETGTMLPPGRSDRMQALYNIPDQHVVVDVRCTGVRAAMVVLTPDAGEEALIHRWCPDDGMLVEIFRISGEDIKCNVLSRDRLDQDEWEIDDKFSHRLDALPREYADRIRQIAFDDTHTTRTIEKYMDVIWRNMAIVMVWETEPRCDIDALIQFVATR